MREPEAGISKKYRLPCLFCLPWFKDRIRGAYRYISEAMGKRRIPFVLLLAVLLLGTGCLMPLAAQDVVRKSEKMRPVWLSDKTPRTTNATFHYRVVEAVGKTLDEARHNCLLVLSEDVERTWKVSGQGTQDIRSEQVNGNISEQSVFTYHYDVAGEEVSVTTTRYDEYWECRSYPDGMRYHCYMLFGVADTAQPDFDRLSFTRKYGARGLWRSMIIPGWGQMYKGSTVKGLCILGGEVLLATGIIVTESQRSSYVKKMKEQPQHLQTYNTKADNWSNARNVCIGAAAALYVYNLVDALVANGRKRAVTQKKVYFSLQPSVGDCNGIGRR